MSEHLHLHAYTHKHTHKHSHELSHDIHEHSDNHTQDPAIFSEAHGLSFSHKVSPEEIQQALSLWIEKIIEWAKNNASLVGHIKIFVEGQEYLWLSSTGRSINVKHSSGWSEWLKNSINLNVTAIIFGVSMKDLEEVARLKLKECIDLIL